MLLRNAQTVIYQFSFVFLHKPSQSVRKGLKCGGKTGPNSIEELIRGDGHAWRAEHILYVGGPALDGQDSRPNTEQPVQGAMIDEPPASLLHCQRTWLKRRKQASCKDGNVVGGRLVQRHHSPWRAVAGVTVTEREGESQRDKSLYTVL